MILILIMKLIVILDLYINYFLKKNKKQKCKMKILLIQISQMHKLRLVIHAI